MIACMHGQHADAMGVVCMDSMLRHGGRGTHLTTLDTDVLLSHENVMDPIPATVL